MQDKYVFKENLITKNEYEMQSVYLEITSQCNLRCLHCYNDSGVLTELISLEALENIFIDLDASKLEVTLSGGEPLIHPQFWDILDRVIALKAKRILIITNGTLIDEQTAQKFLQHQEYCTVQFSINGSCAEYHDKLCGTGSFNSTIRGLNNLLSIGFSNIVVRTMVTQFNVKDIVDCIDFLVRMGISSISLGYLRCSGRGLDNQSKLLIAIDELNRLVDSLKNNSRIQFLIQEQGIKINIPEVLSPGCPLIYPHSEAALPFSPRIDSAGNVYMCQAFSDSIYSFGNINKLTLTQICNSPELAALLNFLILGMNYMHQCQECIWSTSCGRGCVADILNNGNIQVTDGYCDFRQEYFEATLFAEPNLTNVLTKS